MRFVSRQFVAERTCQGRLWNSKSLNQSLKLLLQVAIRFSSLLGDSQQIFGRLKVQLSQLAQTDSGRMILLESFFQILIELY